MKRLDYSKGMLAADGSLRALSARQPIRRSSVQVVLTDGVHFSAAAAAGHRLTGDDRPSALAAVTAESARRPGPETVSN
jgi:hypothetical protein